jgi:hypothetical protein
MLNLNFKHTFMKNFITKNEDYKDFNDKRRVIDRRIVETTFRACLDFFFLKINIL